MVLSCCQLTQNLHPNTPTNVTAQVNDGVVTVEWDNQPNNLSTLIRYRISGEVTSVQHDLGYSEGIRFVFNISELNIPEGKNTFFLYVYGSNSVAPSNLSTKDKCTWIFDNKPVSPRAPTVRVDF